ncbi:MAG: NUDIX hydrolase [Bacteroidota bacterium]
MPIRLNELANQLEQRLLQPLPGAVAHEPLRATPIGSVIPKFEHKLPPKPGSVLILLYEGADGRIKFPLIKRPEYMGAHSGQVSFPGGKAETGETIIETALREAEEEIGVKSTDVKVLGRLSDFFVIPSNFMVAPVVGCLDRQAAFAPDPIEVVRILGGDLESLIAEDAARVKEITAAGRFSNDGTALRSGR